MVGRMGSLGHLFDQIQVKYVKNIVMTITIEVTVAKTGPRTVGYAMRTLWTRRAKEREPLAELRLERGYREKDGERGVSVCIDVNARTCEYMGALLEGSVVQGRDVGHRERRAQWRCCTLVKTWFMELVKKLIKCKRSSRSCCTAHTRDRS